MEILLVVPAALVVLVSLASAYADFTKAPMVYASLKSVGVADWAFPILGSLKVAGAAGLVAGIALPQLGTLAGACLALYYLAGAGAHLRAGQGLKAAAVPLFLAALSLVATLVALPNSA